MTFTRDLHVFVVSGYRDASTEKKAFKLNQRYEEESTQ